MEDDEEPIRSWTGEVLAANFDAVALYFTYAGEPAKAIAVADVCYDDNGEVRNLYTCEGYSPGSRIYFDAIYSSQSDMPDVWKIAVAWTQRKPRDQDVFDVYSDSDDLVELYKGCYIHSSLIDGDSDVPDKDLDTEMEAIEFFVGQLKKNICRGIIYNIETDDLGELLDEADETIVDYVRDCHNEVLDFFLFHRNIFHVTKNNMIFPCRSNKLQNYFRDRLPEMIDGEDDSWDDDDDDYDWDTSTTYNSSSSSYY